MCDSYGQDEIREVARRIASRVRPVHDLADAKLVDDRGSPVVEQLTFANFLTAGEFDRHLRRMRPRYRTRRDALLPARGARLPDLVPSGTSRRPALGDLAARRPRRAGRGRGG